MGYEPISFFGGDIHWISNLHTSFNSPQEWGYMRATLTHTCFAVAMSTESLSTLFSYNPGRKRLVVQSLRMVNLQGTYVLSFFSQLLSYCLQCLALAINTFIFSDLCVTSAETSLALLSPILIGSFGSNLSSYSFFFLALLHYEDSVWEAETCQCWRNLCSTTTLSSFHLSLFAS